MRRADVVWLFGDDRVGLMLTANAKSFVAPLLPADRDARPPRVVLQIAEASVRFDEEERRTLTAVFRLLDGGGDLHLHQTYHLIYPPGTRILTLSRQSPLPLIYREIRSLALHLL